MELILVRHGETVTNAMQDTAAMPYTGQLDVALTENGRQQAAALRENPVFRDVDVWFSSDLSRAVETARLISGTEPTQDPRLRERSMGDFEGQLIRAVREDPRYEKYFHDPACQNFRHDFIQKAPNGESYSDVCARLSDFLAEVGKSGLQKIVIVAHFCTIRCLMHLLGGLSREEALTLYVPNCVPICLKKEGLL